MEMAKVETRTRARATLAIEAPATAAAATSPAPSPKRRKIDKNSTSQDLVFSASSFVDQLKSIRKETVPTAGEERCSSGPASDESTASCYSSNGSFELDEERIKFIDLEVQSSQAETSTCCNCDEIRRETSLLSELGTNSQEVESMEKSTTKASSRSVLSTPMKMPTELELEEFFAAAEKDMQKRFSDKYNYDIVKDMPLKGRYEWVQLNP